MRFRTVKCSLVRVRHTPFPGQSECFVAVFFTLFVHIDSASCMNGYCSLKFLSVKCNTLHGTEYKIT